MHSVKLVCIYVDVARFLPKSLSFISTSPAKCIGQRLKCQKEKGKEKEADANSKKYLTNKCNILEIISVFVKNLLSISQCGYLV